MASTWALLAGGGTAGHVLPAVAVAQALVDAGHPPSTVHFVVSTQPIDERLVRAAGFDLTALPGRGVERRLSLASARAAWGLVRAVPTAIALVRRLRPRVVVAVGGYASLACGLAAVLWRVPLVVAEGNAYPGLANRVLARFARASAVAFPGTALPRAVVTGNPVRREMAAVDRSPAGRAAGRRALGLPPDRRVLAVFGGSLGARHVNEAATGLVERWRDRADVAVHHVVGRDWEDVRDRLPRPPPGGLVYQAVEYEDRMPELFAAADLAVCRAGASTLAELAAAGLPALLVPLPIATEDHQAKGAVAMAEAGAALWVRDADLTVDWLAERAGALLADPARLDAMSAAARRLGRPDAAARVAALVAEHARA